ncbi:helix-turn-helix domain-containing protein [Undibacterium sp. KW1]|uniref:helix-turn-helix domain-containing protein n=1 Tax=Undibacterium sp. KW1 TaxID=2058624 RepID=UPI00351ADFDD
MALLGIIRRWHIRDQIPLPEIARRLGISRNTVRRYLRSEVREPAYADRQTTSAIDKYALQLSSWLKTEASKNRKQRRSLKQLHLDLKELGFEGSYDRVADFARKWKVDQTDRVNSASKRTIPSLNEILGAKNDLNSCEKRWDTSDLNIEITKNANMGTTLGYYDLK